jgi:hypothetical protein
MALATVPAIAQDKQPYSEANPTKESPLRFSAFAVNMQAHLTGEVMITIERWTAKDERDGLLALVETSTDKPGGQDKLLKGLQDIKPRTGFIRLPATLGWDLKYAHEDTAPDGSRRIVVATDKPISGMAVASGSRTLDYPFSLIEMRFPAGSDKGEGKMLSQSSLSVKDGKLSIEIYGQEPTRLTTITEKNPKQKK